MRKIDIFKDVVSIMAEDSSTKKDIQGANPSPFCNRISDEMSEEDFLYQVQTYLASFGVIGHVSFRRKGVKPKGFVLRSSNQGLYVEQAHADTQLQVGDQILKIDGQRLEQVEAKHEAYFVSSQPERRYREWADLVLRAGTVTILRQGLEQEIAVQTSQEEKTSQFEWKVLKDGVVYLRLDNFMNESAISQLYEEAREAISRSSNLIIDVRRNAGGTDSLYFPLLHYALAEGQGYSAIDWEDEGMEILYTERNVDLRLQDIEEWTQQGEVSSETRALLEDMKQELLANRGKGYVTYETEDGDFFPEVVGGRYPERIFVLSDVYCGSSGDNFLQMIKQFPKVKVLGRPSLGILDYSNCCQIDYGDYVLMFPTSRSLALDKGCGMADRGVEPHIFIPWTVEHLKRDVDLEKCLELIHSLA